MAATYPSEPILAEAACQLLYKCKGDTKLGWSFSSENLPRVLKVFGARCVNGLVSAGTIGEVIARMVLALTHDLVHLDAYGKSTVVADLFFTFPIPLTAFLDTLVGSSYIPSSGFEVPASLVSGFISFTNWASPDRLPEAFVDDEYLGECYRRHAAIILPPNHRGADLLIPIFLRENSFSYILIQVKNRVNPRGRFTDAGKKLTPKHCFEDEDKFFKNSRDYISIFMEMVPEAKKASEKSLEKHVKDHKQHLLVLGFKSIPWLNLSEYSSIKSSIEGLHRSQITNVESKTRYGQLKAIAPLDFYFTKVWLLRCDCKSKCRTSECSCRSANPRRSCTRVCKCHSHYQDNSCRCSNR